MPNNNVFDYSVPSWRVGPDLPFPTSDGNYILGLSRATLPDGVRYQTFWTKNLPYTLPNTDGEYTLNVTRTTTDGVVSYNYEWETEPTDIPMPDTEPAADGAYTLKVTRTTTDGVVSYAYTWESVSP